MDQQESTVQPMNQWINKEGRQVVWQGTPKHRISPICVTLAQRLESCKDDSTSEAHLQSSKTSRGSYKDPELYIFVKMFQFYLVTQSLFKAVCNKNLGTG